MNLVFCVCTKEEFDKNYGEESCVDNEGAVIIYDSNELDGCNMDPELIPYIPFLVEDMEFMYSLYDVESKAYMQFDEARKKLTEFGMIEMPELVKYAAKLF